MRKFLGSLLEVIEVTVIAIAAVFLIRTFLVQPFLVSGDSMAPTFHDGDYLLIDELTYRLREPQRGEVVVFKYPKDENLFFIKRIVGLPGEELRIEAGKVVVINGEHPTGFVLEESYLPDDILTSGNEDISLGSGEYLVLGDNRPYSLDSRTWGPVNASGITGLVRLRLLPLGAIEAFAAPQYQYP